MMFFVLKNILLGAGLAMDAFSVSIANALQNPGMRRRRALIIAGAFAFFQFLMPMIGWACVHTVSAHFRLFQRAVPYIAFLLLVLIGGKMVLEGARGEKSGQEEEAGAAAAGAAAELSGRGSAAAGTERKVTGTELLVQAVATSIDALSVGFTIAAYSELRAFAASVLIAAVTMAICLAGIRIGRFFGMRLAGRATVVGGVILVAIGFRILLGGGF